jgi:hypothetical protein
VTACLRFDMTEGTFFNMRQPLHTMTLMAMLFFGGASATSVAAAPPPADRVYRNAVIFTADSRRPRAEALAERDGRIVFVGGNRGVSRYIGAATTVVDLAGSFSDAGSSSTGTCIRSTPDRSC